MRMISARRMARAGGLLCGVLLLAVAGCNRNAERTPTTQPAAVPVEKHAERGPVRLTVRVDRDRVTIAEKLELTVVADAAEGVEVEMPAFGDKLDEFQIRDFHDQPSVPTGTGRRWEQRYVLESFLSGSYEIPPVTIHFTDERKQADATTSQPAEPIRAELSSEPIPVEVTSLLEGEFDPKDFADIKGMVALPVERRWAWLIWTLAGVGLVALGVIAILLWARRKRIEAVPIVPPEQWARLALVCLREAGLVERREVAEFYYRLTGIVRGYIERRYKVMAAEQTTEEFLAGAEDHPSLGKRHGRLLTDFLRAGDLVKFARHEPASEEIEQAFEAAENFVEQTTAEEQVGQAGQPVESGSASGEGGQP